MPIRATDALYVRKYLAELGYPAPRTVSKLVDQVRPPSAVARVHTDLVSGLPLLSGCLLGELESSHVARILVNRRRFDNRNAYTDCPASSARLKLQLLRALAPSTCHLHEASVHSALRFLRPHRLPTSFLIVRYKRAAE